jgi:hypothetical protein
LFRESKRVGLRPPFMSLGAIGFTAELSGLLNLATWC